MAPKLQLMPGLRMTTRASNKDKHPGNILLGNPRRTSEEMNQLREEAARLREAEEERLTAAIKKVAQIEDERHDKENELELEHCQCRAQLRAEANESCIGSSTVVAPSGKRQENKSDGISSIASKKLQDVVSNDASKRLQRAVTTNGKGKIVVDEADEEEPNSASNTDQDPDYEKASGSDSAAGDNADESEAAEASDASEVVAKKRKRSNSSKMKKVKKGREDIKAMRTKNATPLNNKRKAVSDETGPETHAKKKQKEDDTTGFDPEWVDFVKKHAAPKVIKRRFPAAVAPDEESFIQYGGLVGDNEDDTEEASALGKAVLKPKKAGKDLYPSIQIQNNSTNEPKTMKEARGGDERWKDKHLPEASKSPFKEEVIPRICQLVGALNPWATLTQAHIQSVLDQVFGEGKYSTERDKVFFGLAKMRIKNWRNGFSKAAVEAVQTIINDNADVLNTGAARKEFIGQYLSKAPLSPDSDHDTYAYQWAEWGASGAAKRGFCQNTLILHTFANAHLVHIQGFENFENEKPIGALLMAMQAVGRALEIWIDGEKSLKKPPAFSNDNYGDTCVRIAGYPKRRRLIRRATFFIPTLEGADNNTWDTIINQAHEYLPESKKEPATRSSISSSLADAEEIKDPDSNFVMVV